MNNITDLNIKPTVKHFVGDKIPIDDILNKKIIIHDFKIEDSKCFRGRSDKCLTLQITVDNHKRIVFTSGSELIDIISKVSDNEFPVTATIIKVEKVLKFS
jgi:hypothetical protein